MTCLFLQMYFWPAIQFPCIEHVKDPGWDVQNSSGTPKITPFSGGDRHKNLDDWFSKPLIVINEHHKTDRLFYSLLHFPQVSESESHLVMSNSLRPHGLYSPWTSAVQNTGVGNLSLLQGIFPTQGSNPGPPHCRWILYQLSHQGSPRILEWVAYPFFNGSSHPRDQTGVSCTKAQVKHSDALHRHSYCALSFPGWV